MTDPVNEGLVQMRDMIATAKADCRRRIDALIDEAERLEDTFVAAVGEVSAEQAFYGWKAALIRKLKED